MSRTEVKRRMIGFRLSADEYTEVYQICRARGYGTISHFARCSVLALIPGVFGDRPQGPELNDMQRRIDALTSDVERLSEVIRNRHKIRCSMCGASM